jgi:hypothetical protein
MKLTTGWVEMPSLPSTLAFHCMAYKDDETIMVVGGIENNFCCSDSTYILDAESQVSISPTFYGLLFCTKVFRSAFFYLQFGFVIFLQKIIG